MGDDDHCTDSSRLQSFASPCEKGLPTSPSVVVQREGDHVHQVGPRLGHLGGEKGRQEAEQLGTVPVPFFLIADVDGVFHHRLRVQVELDPLRLGPLLGRLLTLRRGPEQPSGHGLVLQERRKKMVAGLTSSSKQQQD